MAQDTINLGGGLETSPQQEQMVEDRLPNFDELQIRAQELMAKDKRKPGKSPQGQEMKADMNQIDSLLSSLEKDPDNEFIKERLDSFLAYYEEKIGKKLYKELEATPRDELILEINEIIQKYSQKLEKLKKGYIGLESTKEKLFKDANFYLNSAINARNDLELELTKSQALQAEQTAKTSLALTGKELEEYEENWEVIKEKMIEEIKLVEYAEHHSQMLSIYKEFIPSDLEVRVTYQSYDENGEIITQESLFPAEEMVKAYEKNISEYSPRQEDFTQEKEIKGQQIFNQFEYTLDNALYQNVTYIISWVENNILTQELSEDSKEQIERKLRAMELLIYEFSQKKAKQLEEDEMLFEEEKALTSKKRFELFSNIKKHYEELIEIFNNEQIGYEGIEPEQILIEYEDPVKAFALKSVENKILEAPKTAEQEAEIIDEDVITKQTPPPAMEVKDETWKELYTDPEETPEVSPAPYEIGKPEPKIEPAPVEEWGRAFADEPYEASAQQMQTAEADEDFVTEEMVPPLSMEVQEPEIDLPKEVDEDIVTEETGPPPSMIMLETEEEEPEIEIDVEEPGEVSEDIEFTPEDALAQEQLEKKKDELVMRLEVLKTKLTGFLIKQGIEQGQESRRIKDLQNQINIFDKTFDELEFENQLSMFDEDLKELESQFRSLEQDSAQVKEDVEQEMLPKTEFIWNKEFNQAWQELEVIGLNVGTEDLDPEKDHMKLLARQGENTEKAKEAFDGLVDMLNEYFKEGLEPNLQKLDEKLIWLQEVSMVRRKQALERLLPEIQNTLSESMKRVDDILENTPIVLEKILEFYNENPNNQIQEQYFDLLEVMKFCINKRIELTERNTQIQAIQESYSDYYEHPDKLPIEGIRTRSIQTKIINKDFGEQRLTGEQKNALDKMEMKFNWVKRSIDKDVEKQGERLDVKRIKEAWDNIDLSEINKHLKNNPSLIPQFDSAFQVITENYKKDPPEYVKILNKLKEVKKMFRVGNIRKMNEIAEKYEMQNPKDSTAFNAPMKQLKGIGTYEANYVYHILKERQEIRKLQEKAEKLRQGITEDAVTAKLEKSLKYLDRYLKEARQDARKGATLDQLFDNAGPVKDTLLGHGDFDNALETLKQYSQDPKTYNSELYNAILVYEKNKIQRGAHAIIVESIKNWHDTDKPLDNVKHKSGEVSDEVRLVT